MTTAFGSRGAAVADVQRLVNDYLAREHAGITPAEVARAIASAPADVRERARQAVDKIVAAGWQLKVDEDFGGVTDAAVRLVQSNEDGLAVDGTVGPMTCARLERRTVQPVEVEDPTKNGLLIRGEVVAVPGFKVIGPHDAAWAHLAPGDARRRPRKTDGSLLYDLMQWIIHKTVADDPEVLIEGKGPPGGARRTAEYFQEDPVYGGVQVVVGDDGEIACLCDLYEVEAFHATASNRYSVGSELREVGPRRGEKGGKFYRAALDANVAAIMTGAPKLGIQLQMQRRGTYTGHPLKRMQAYDGKVDFGKTPGGPDMVGIFGHRLNTERRGKWDPGEIIWDELAKRGVEEFDFDKGEDLVAWSDRQTDLVHRGHKIAITGVPNSATRMALLAEGYINGILALGKAPS